MKEPESSIDQGGDREIEENVAQDALDKVFSHPLLHGRQHALRELIGAVPESYRATYVQRLENAAALFGKKEAMAASQVQGIHFELSRIAIAVRQGLEQLDFGTSLPQEVEYLGFDAKEKDFSEKNLKPKRSPISLDVPLVRIDVDEKGNPSSQAYVYEVKAYPRMAYGSSAADRNQILKYQRAVESGLVAGATVELKGRLDASFLKWLVGESIFEHGAAPDVEMIYVLELPSGAEYRFVLNGREGQKGLRFRNEHDTFTKEDQEAVSGIFRAVVDRSVVKILASNEVQNPTDALKPLIDDPYNKITTRELFDEYGVGRTKAMQEAFRKKGKESLINDTNERSSVDIAEKDEREQRIAVGHIFDAFQESLEHDPELQTMRERYSISNVQVREAIIDEALAMVKKVAEFEVGRRSASSVERPGYRGKPEGVALSVDSIVFDAVYNVLRRQKGEAERSYDLPERFDTVTMESVMQYLETQDRVYATCDIFDPVTGTTEALVGDGSAEATRRIEKLKAKIPAENEKRLLEMFQKTVDEQKAFEGPLDAKSGKRLTMPLQEVSNLERRIKNRKDALKSLSAEKGLLEKQVRTASGEEKIGIQNRLNVTMDLLKKQSEVSRVANLQDKQKLDDVRKQFIGEDGWKKAEIRVVGEKVRNLIKFIYTISADGEARLCEEKVKVNARIRSTHSEVAQGRNVYGAGEIIFEKIDGKWTPIELNNGSGHYRPSRLTLPYVAEVMSKNLDMEQCVTRDVLLRGVITPEFNSVLES